MRNAQIEKYDIICVGAGIMSTTLALLIKLLDPDKKIVIFERLGEAAQESTAAWNNAGTGHSAFCELNYTSEDAHGNMDISKAEKVCMQFEASRHFWTYLVEEKYIYEPETFVRQVPHHAWVRGEANSSFLKKRYDSMKDHYMFQGMEYTTDHALMREWFPLIMQGRPAEGKLAATRMEQGLEVNFEALAKHYLFILRDKYDIDIIYNTEIQDVDPDTDKDWTVEAFNILTDEKTRYEADHVFIGAGGGALPLLQKVEIPEKDGYGGFPVSGEWLICKNPKIIEQHWAKVYSKADVGSPPMSVPHLDTRVIDGKRELLFGPFAGFSMKFLKDGSQMDLAKSLKLDNIPSMWGAFWHNLPLTEYLIEQVMMDHGDRMEQLRKFVIDASPDDWELLHAGQRVQIIKKNEAEGGSLEFGTEVVKSQDGSITALLGASPGASTAVHIMMEVIEAAYPELLVEKAEILSDILPLYGKNPSDHKEEVIRLRRKNMEVLGLASQNRF